MHLMTISRIRHNDDKGRVLWERFNIPNTFHSGGQEFLMKVAFITASGVTVPSSYYVGLDARSTLAVTDTLTTISGEPTQFGYSRQTLSSANGFSLTTSGNNYKLISNILTFSATGGTWGPVSCVFLTTGAGSVGYLISSALLPEARTVQSGQSITMQIDLSLINC